MNTLVPGKQTDENLGKAQTTIHSKTLIMKKMNFIIRYMALCTDIVCVGRSMEIDSIRIASLSIQVYDLLGFPFLMNIFGEMISSAGITTNGAIAPSVLH